MAIWIWKFPTRTKLIPCWLASVQVNKTVTLRISEFRGLVKDTPLWGVQVTLVTASQLNVGRSKQTTFVNEREEVEKTTLPINWVTRVRQKSFSFCFFLSFFLMDCFLIQPVRETATAVSTSSPSIGPATLN